MKKCILLALFIYSILYSSAQSTSISGIVFEDSNGNGVQDRSERGLRGIPISNGDTIVLTQRGGVFRIEAEKGYCIFPILPAKYRFKGVGAVNSRFHYISDYISDYIVVFPLIKQEIKDNFKLAAVGDVQYENSDEASYANRTIMSELANREDVDQYIFLGDLVNDTTGMFPLFSSMLDKLPKQSWTVVGNHDLGAAFPRNTDDYCMEFGAENYAYNYGDVHFIVLNNVLTVKQRGYEAFITERQLRFVRNSIELLDKKTLIVISMHIPLIYTKNKEQLISLLTERERVLVLSGHTHTIGRHSLADNIHELIAGSVCGMWWTGERDYAALPTSPQGCGSPRNYFIIDFSDGDYTLSYKGIGLSAEKQMDIWVRGEESLDNQVKGLSDLEVGTVIVNVYGGGDKTEVSMQIDGGERIDLTHKKIVPPNILRIRDWNRRAGYPTKFSRRSPFRETASPHMWIGVLPDKYCNGTHIIKVKASDDYGLNTIYSHIVTINK